MLDFEERIVGRGGVFTPLEDVAFFKQVRVDPDARIIVWPNDVDLDPDVFSVRLLVRPSSWARKCSPDMVGRAVTIGRSSSSEQSIGETLEGAKVAARMLKNRR